MCSRRPVAWLSRDLCVYCYLDIGQPGATSAVASRLSTTTTMSDPPPPPPTQRKSRVLAALDNPAFFSQNPTTTSLARTLPPLSSDLATPIKQRLDTPVPFNVSIILGSAGVGSSQKKRKVSGPENDYDYPQASGSTSGRDREFGLNYDQETPVRSIDRGGDDQATKYVCSFLALPPPLKPPMLYRMAEFVSQGIDNAAHGLTTEKAMEQLKLSE